MRRTIGMGTVAWGVWLAACSGSAEPTGPPPICKAGSQWERGEDAFRDATREWGLRDFEMRGVHFNAVDFDGDGWTDLAVRAGGDADDFAEDVRHAWLLRNEGGTGFADVTEASGIRQPRKGPARRGRPGQVWVWADVDNDGDLDVYTGLPDAGSAEEETSELMINQGDGTFALGPRGSPLRNGTDNPFAAAFTDVDRDGFVDLFLAHYPNVQDELFLGGGEGSFRRRTDAAGLTTLSWNDRDALNRGEAHSQAWAAVACDVDDDGDPDLLVSSYGRAPNHLWRNVGGRFENRSIASGYAFDGRDDWTDNESARCWCTLNPDDEDCAGVPPPSAIACAVEDDAFRWNHANDREPFRLGGNSGQTVCADVDNDGDMDLLTAEIVHWDVGSSSDPSELVVNDGSGSFERPGNEATGLTREHALAAWNDGDITGEIFDFDNDGWPDLYIGGTDYEGTRGLLFHQEGPGRFAAVPLRQGIDHTRSHGSVAADFDRDGDLDLVVGHSKARCASDCYDNPTPRLFENLSEEGNFLQLNLVGTGGTNRAAVGARVEVTAGGVTQTQEVGGGGGQQGDQAPLVLHFGLGAACEAEVTVRWPDADLSTSTYTLGGGYRYRIEQKGMVVVE